MRIIKNLLGWECLGMNEPGNDSGRCQLFLLGCGFEIHTLCLIKSCIKSIKRGAAVCKERSTLPNLWAKGKGVKANKIPQSEKESSFEWNNGKKWAGNVLQQQCVWQNKETKAVECCRRGTGQLWNKSLPLPGTRHGPLTGHVAAVSFICKWG